MNVLSSTNWNSLVEYIGDMYTCLEDIEDIVYQWNNSSCWLQLSDVTVISMKCQNIVAHTLNLILTFMKNTTCMNIRDKLKKQYNKFRRLDYKYGHVSWIPPYHNSMIYDNIPQQISEIVEKITNCISDLHDIRMNFNPGEKNIKNFKCFSASIKKFESSLIAVIFTIEKQNMLLEVIEKLNYMILLMH